MAERRRSIAWPAWRLAPVLIALGLVVMGLGMAFLNERLVRGEQIRQATVQADILAGSVSAALAFDDSKLAQEYVDALRVNPEVEAAGVYGLDGRLVAAYAAPGAAPLGADRAHAARPGEDDIVVSRPVAQAGVPLGSVYLKLMRDPILRRLSRYAGIGLLVLMAALVVVVLGASNRSLIEAHRKLQAEMAERERAEAALLHSRELEAAAQLEIAAQKSRAALQQSEQQLEFALRAGRLGSWSFDIETGAMTASEVFRTNIKAGVDAPLAHIDDFDRFVHPDDRARNIQARLTAIRDHTDLDSEFRTQSPEGEVRWILSRGRAVYDESGKALRMAGVSLDITARKAAEERQRLLLDELNHRVKNTLATVQSIAIQTRRDTQDAAAFERAFLERLSALARVHDLLSRVSWEGASLADVVSQTLAPHFVASNRGGRLSLDGPDVRLGPNAAVTLTMAFHELTTNAAKYGALSVDSGRVQVRWRADDLLSPRAIEITWREIGGPTVIPPARRGFGTRFIETGLAREFDGAVELEFNPEGVRCRMTIPLSLKFRMAA